MATNNAKARASEARSLPSNLEAEKSVLGAILAHNPGLDLITLRPRDFYTEQHQHVFAAMVALASEHRAIDLVTLKARLGQVGKLEAAGGPAYLASLTDGVPKSTNVAHYARLVAEAALRRALIGAGNAIVSQAYLGERSATDLLLEADKRFLGLRAGGPSTMTPLGEGVSALMADLEYRNTHRDELRGVETGIGTLDRLTGGWQAGDLIVIGARPSVGKTSFTVQAAIAAARKGVRVAFFSFEMRRRQLEVRILSHLSGVNSLRLLTGHTSEREYAPISHAVNEMAALPLAIDDAGSQRTWDVRSTCRRMQAEGGLGLVIIDYVQLITGDEKHRGNRNMEITEISRTLKIAAGELDVPILLLSQLNRANDKRKDPRPQLSDLRESGSLEQDADLVCFLHRRDHREAGFTEFIVQKARNGPTGTVNLDFQPATTTFGEWVGDPPVEKAKKPTQQRPNTPIDDLPYDDTPEEDLP